MIYCSKIQIQDNLAQDTWYNIQRYVKSIFQIYVFSVLAI